MKKNASILYFLIIGMLAIITSCSKDDDEPGLPTLSFIQDTGYVYSNATAPFGDTLKMGIIANSNGTDNLVKCQIFNNGISILDSSINAASFQYEFSLTKSVATKDILVFRVTDLAGHINTDSITITGNFGEINTYSSIVFGAQDNATVESFLSYSNNSATKYFQNAAFDHQADIDMFCFYENTAGHQNMMTLAAPGSNITGIFEGESSPENYTVKNVTYFVKTSLTIAEFDAVQNDAVILASFEPENQYKKAKVLTAGDVYAFLLQSGKQGLYKVVAVDGTETGTLEIAVKIQK